MIGTIAFYLYYSMLLAFGIVLSAAFSGIHPSKKNLLIGLGLFVFCGLLQLASFLTLGKDLTQFLYPLLTHAPIILLICLYYRKHFSTVFAAVTSAYLCCQPANWMGMFVNTVFQNNAMEYIVRLLVMVVVAYVSLRYLSTSISQIYNKDIRSPWVFGIIPMVYYLFDYCIHIYTTLWLTHNQLVLEFLPFFLCIAHMVFCIVYYQQYELRADAERNEQLNRMILDQQSREIETVTRNEQSIRILRHDMRHVLNSLQLCIEADDKETAQKIIAGYTENIDAATLQRYCANDTLNYVLSAFAARCKSADVDFQVNADLAAEIPMEVMFCSILSNALENALNAQADLPANKRKIKVRLTSRDGKILLSVQNPYWKQPVFVDGIPISTRRGHGYGTQSIRFLTERMGGNCQFVAENNVFSVRIII